MRILQIYELGPLDHERVYNGIDVAILELSQNLTKLGHEVTILAGGNEANSNTRYHSNGIDFISVDLFNLMQKTWSAVNLNLLRQLTFPLAVLKEKLGNFDIYHGHVYTSGFIANYLARKKGGKVVNTLHGSYYPIWKEIKPYLQARFYETGERRLAPTLARISDLQIHTGKYFATQVINWGAPEQKIKVIPNGVNIEKFNPDAKPIDYNKCCPIIFTARRLVKKNGLAYLIRALHKVLKVGECKLLIAGDGPEKPRLEALVGRLGISNNVHFLGLLPHDSIPSYLALADIVVVPSMIEASSLFILEAMAMAKPVISSNAGGIPEIIGQDTGILAEPMNNRELANKILQLLHDEQRRAELGNNAYQRVIKKYTWVKIACQTEKEYMRILKEV